METILKMFEIDFISVFTSVLTIILGAKACTSVFEWFCEKFGIEFRHMRKKKEEHDLLRKTSENLKRLEKKHEADLSGFQKIQEESMEKLNVQIETLRNANRELLADKINQKYKNYISLGGIPADELDEFTSLHRAYNSCGGNHHGDAKYRYVIEHLPVIPDETKLPQKQSE